MYVIGFRWILHGELTDDHKEFFIATVPTSTVQSSSHSEVNLWHSLYHIVPAMLPTFFSSKLAHQILVVGKSINFIKACFRYDEKSNPKNIKKIERNRSTSSAVNSDNNIADNDR
jgi:hypothetical protein